MGLKFILSIILLSICMLTSCGNDENKNQSSDKSVDDNINNQIVTSSGYIWEAIDKEIGIYTNLAFYSDGTFSTSVYQMNGDTNNLTLITTFKGSWILANNGKSAIGKYDTIDDSLRWEFNTNYSSLTNNKGAVFNRIKAK